MTRHRRFLAAFALGLMALVLSHALILSLQMRLILAAGVFFAIYLALMGHFIRGVTPDRLRRRAEASDEGVALILVLALTAVAVSLTSIVFLLNGPGGGDPWERALALVVVPLGWASVHVVAAFHYAHLFYRPDAPGDGGLGFPGPSDPGAWEFLYFAFTIAMTAQVSDVTATSTPMRRAVLVHAIGAFFYNTVILALAVNAALTAGG